MTTQTGIFIWEGYDGARGTTHQHLRVPTLADSYHCTACGHRSNFSNVTGQRPEGLPNQAGVMHMTNTIRARRWHRDKDCPQLRHAGESRVFEGYFACRTCVPYAPNPPRGQ